MCISSVVADCSASNMCPVAGTCDVCHHGGTCAYDSSRGHKCHCVEGFSGKRCQNNIDDCERHPCKVRGV